MRALIYIFLGGGLGSVFRFLISNYTEKWMAIKSIPFGTFTVNILGCFLIGMLSAYFLKVDNYLKFLLITGFCGGFTTFSTFSAENFSLWQNGHYISLVLYILSSVLFGLIAVYLGFQLLKAR